MHEEGWQNFSSGHINGPVYISIDKDVLNPASAATNWDQGSLSLWELEKLLAVILQKEQVVGIDICGECSTTLNLFEEKRETVMDSQANKELPHVPHYEIPFSIRMVEYIHFHEVNKHRRLLRQSYLSS